jgi:hypothetical protein
VRHITWLLVVFVAIACSEGDPRDLENPLPVENVFADVPVPVERPDRDSPAAGFDGRPPVFAETAPPPISGGTLLASRDGTRLVVADPDRDQLWVLALPSGSILERHDFESGAERGGVT